jgi:hypothetical protein
MIWATFCLAWATPAIASLERFKIMSERTQDEFTETPPDQPDRETLPREEMTSQIEQPGAETAQAEQPVEAAPENTLPPEAQGETNGGPLGCCLGIMVGLLLSLTLAILSRSYATVLGSMLQGNYWLLGLMVRILMGILAFALAIFFGYLGWGLGKRFYREYEPPPIKKRKERSRSKKLHQGA